MHKALWTKDAPKIGRTSFSGGHIELAEGNGDGVVAGWASTPMPDLYGHIVANGAFEASIRDAGLAGPRGIQLLVNHDWDKPAGVITTLEYRPKGLWIEARLDLNISYAKDMYFAAKARGGLSFSVGFRPSREPGDIEFVDGENGAEYIVIRKGQLREVSVIANPANSDAIMEFIKSEKTDAMEFMTKAEPDWRVGASRNLPVAADTRWDGAAARARIFDAAGFNDKDPDPGMARRAFLVYDANNPLLRGSYKLPFADIIDGRMRASPAGLRAAASRLPQTDIPESARIRAQDVLDDYSERFEKAAKDLTLPKLQQMLVDEGWVKDEGAAEGLTKIVQANLHLFEPEEHDLLVKTESVERVLRKIRSTRALLNNQKEGGNA